ncbi:MAG: phasin family protein [Pseudomonadota bacterium]
MPKGTKKSDMRAKARKTGRAIESGAVELSRNIWLAGIGAYGMAFQVARSGAVAVNEQSVEMFEDLVKRGSEIESDVLSKIGETTAFTAATKRAQKVADTSQKLQEQVRDRFDARMERMRGLLGINKEGTIGNKLVRRLEKLEDDVATATKGTLKQGDLMLKKRLARLSDEIDAYVGDLDEPEAEPKPKATPKKGKPKAAKKKAKKPKKVKIDDLTVLNGVGPAMAKKLNDNGIKAYADLAALKKADAVKLDEKIGARGRVIRDEWVKQAKQLVKD